jgi:DNA-binding NtrC family response regulator
MRSMRDQTDVVDHTHRGTRYTPGPSSSATARPVADDPDRAEFVGSHPAHLDALRTIETLAPYEQTTVLIVGESGTGKSYAARLLHQRSPRARATFHQVLLSSLDDNLAASDLFGHLSGAYTDARQSRPGHFVTAPPGTLYLDEIRTATRGGPRKLLHAIDRHEIWPVGSDRSVRVDVRVVLASNVPLETLVAEQEFLGDLFARIEPFQVRLPSLRERRADIPALVRQFVALRAAACGHPLGAPKVDPELMAALCRAEWPYNLRQLDGAVQRILIEAAARGSRVLSLEHCVGQLAHLRGSNVRLRVTPQMVRERMAETGSAKATADSLGISRWTVYRYLEKGDVPAPEGERAD